MAKGKSALKNPTQLQSALSAWDGKKHTWPEFRKEVTKWATTNGAAWILNAGRALFNRMQELQEQFKKKRSNFKPTFEAHDEAIWADALQSRDNGCVEAQLDVVKIDTLKQRFGSNFTEFQKCGFTDEVKHANAIENALEQKLLEVNVTVLSALTEAIKEKSETSSQKEALKRILITSEIRHIMDGGPPKDIDEWFDKPQLMPAVVVWFQILWKYEGMSENVDSHFVSDFNEIAESGFGPNPQSISEVNSRLELLLEPAVKAFTTVQDLCDHMRICALVKIIKRLAKGDSKQAVAWKLADDSIVAATRTNTLLTVTNVNNAIALAQRHLDRDNDDDEIETLTTKTDDEIEKLKAELAEAQASIKALKADTTPVNGNGKQGEGQKGKKRPRQGEQKEFKVCSICNRKHKGEPPEAYCFKRDLEGEKKALEELIAKKAAAGFKGEAAAKDRKEVHWKARVALLEDANKTADSYKVSMLDWYASLLLTDEEYAVTLLNVEQGACVDSGSPVDITFLEDEANLTCGEKVYQVHFEVGRPGDPEYGGTIKSPDGTTIVMQYIKGTCNDQASRRAGRKGCANTPRPMVPSPRLRGRKSWLLRLKR
mmetsp:Transcript_71341/g.148936  ORF Transcript_71341/g.148936 Transcript_71341/m.148936 type:complete len:599 (+) Transcript_71341:165-1961(+)